MWSPILLCVFVGLISASSNPGWKSSTQYTYEIRGRTLASLHDVSDQYSGILLNAKLTVQSINDETLQGRISNAQYAQVHTHLPKGWLSTIPDGELSYKDMNLSGKPFQIVMKEGVIRDLIVEKDISNWEANIIKSIVSQFQLDTKGKNLIESHLNTLPEDNNNAVFKTMEETVTGKTETLYEIHQLPQEVLGAQPWLVSQPQLKGDGEFIEVVKSKNYSHSEQLPIYHYGLAGLRGWEVASSQMGSFFTRSSVSRAILSGKLSRYAVQKSYTINEIVMSPTLKEDQTQKGSIRSVLNVTLAEVRDHTETEQLANPVNLGSLVYSYNKPHETTNQARPMHFQMEGQESDESFEQDNQQGRFHRSIEQELRQQQQYRGFQRYYQQQEQPELTSVPESPLLPLTMGFKGRSILKDERFDIVEKVQQLAKGIARDMQEPEKIVKEDSLNKYTTLTTLVRLMNVEQLQTVAKQLYSQQEQSDNVQQLVWVIYRDAVAEAGTGPAFLTIQDWILTKKIVEEEAADVITALASSVRQPTDQYMRVFFDFVKKPEVVDQRCLNETALLAYTNLLRKVYVNKYDSRNQFAVYSFGPFRTQEGKQFLRETVIPYLTQNLHEAINQDETQKVHLYIRALGNVAHREILQAFEPYLEGKKECTQFQRLMMVVSMDKFVTVHPVSARSVLFKIYQNSGEAEELRVAAVYQLMRTAPPTEMLQRMAQHTQVDTSDNVNAAVKSSIEEAAQLQGEQQQYLRSSARAALPLLTKEVYGIQHGGNMLRSYVAEELNYSFKKSIHAINTEEQILPKVVRVALRDQIGGVRRQIFDIQAMLSSVDQLVNIFQKQTKSFQDAQQKQEQQSGNDKWSSATIAHLLNLKGDAREQFEASLNFELGSFQKLFSLDNETIKQIPEVVRHVEQLLKNGKNLKYTRFINTNEMAISFPTEMGLPFLFTYDKPIMMHVDAKLQGVATPELSKDGKLQAPEKLIASAQVQVTISGKTQGRLAFITPFDHQEYVAGYDKFLHMNIPLHGKVEIDLKEKKVVLEMEPCKQGDDLLLHYSSWPYTSKSDITNVQPMILRPATKVIRQQNEQAQTTVLGKRYMGLAFQIEMVQKPKFWNFLWLSHLVRRSDGILAWSSLWNEGAIEHSRINIRALPEESTTKKVVVRMAFQHQYKSQYEDESNASTGSSDLSEIFQTSNKQYNNQQQNQQEYMKKVQAGIHNAHIDSYHTSIEFQGEKDIKYSLTGTMAKSNVDPNSKVLIHFQRSSNSDEIKPFQFGLAAKSYIPNTNGLDLTDSLKEEPVFNSNIKLAFGNNYEQAAKIQAQLELRRSEERKQYLLEQPMYQQCRYEMQQGNHQLPACANMTQRANILDRAIIKLQHENLNEQYIQWAQQIYRVVLLNFVPNYEQRQVSADQNQVNIKAHFFPEFDGVNITVTTPTEQTEIRNVFIKSWARPVLAVHPVFHMPSRVLAKLMNLETYRPICVVDQTQSSTFNYNTLPIGKIGQLWTVMMQYVPIQEHKQQTLAQQLKREVVDNYVVLVRDSKDQQQREVKLIVQTPETEGELIEINMQPAYTHPAQRNAKNPTAKVTVNGQEIKINQQESYDVKKGFVQVYVLRNGEVKVEVRDNLYVIYDGARVKLTTVNTKFLQSVRGICGQLSHGKREVLIASDNTISNNDLKYFFESYQVQEGVQRQHQQRPLALQRQVLYANVISDRDAGREYTQHQGNQYRGMCTKLQTRYVEQNDEICFTVRPVPVCNCQQRGTLTKSVPVHCIKMTNTAKLWKNQIEKGASPDFSKKEPTKSIQMELPQSCGN